MGGDDDRVVDTVEKAGDLIAVTDLGIGFVGNHRNCTAELLLFLLQQFTQLLQRLGRVDDPGRVVRRVDDNRLGALVNRIADGIQIGLKIVLGGNGDRHPLMIVDVEFIFDEKRCQDNYFVAGVEQGF